MENREGIRQREAVSMRFHAWNATSKEIKVTRKYLLQSEDQGDLLDGGDRTTKDAHSILLPERSISLISHPS